MVFGGIVGAEWWILLGLIWLWLVIFIVMTMHVVSRPSPHEEFYEDVMKDIHEL